MPCRHTHPWDRFRVARLWVPRPLRCLVVGENPGSSTTPYFYDPERAVAIRTILLRELHAAGILAAATLEAFRAAGFLFDHGIRCPLDDVTTDRRLARTYASPRANAAAHLTPLIRKASSVWVMGYVARNAAAAAWPGFPRDRGDIARPPYPGPVQAAPTFFVSRYLTRTPAAELGVIVGAFTGFWRARRDEGGSAASG
jgi:hypothetical protein